MHSVFSHSAALVGLIATVSFSGIAHAQWDLIVNVTGATPQQQARIDAAADLWENVIAGYQAGISNTSVTVNVTFEDLPGGILGEAGPTSFANEGGFRISTAGDMTLDTGLGLSTLEDVAAHEIGHIIGIGTLWTDNGVYVNGSGQYTGEAGLAAYREEFDANATFIPVELDGGPGTANAHWDESGFFASELMSGFLSGSNFLSETTIAHLRDIGFDTIGGISELTGVEGDVNQDGVVNSADVTAFVAGWLSVTSDLDAVGRTMLGDLNLDGAVNLADWSILNAADPSAGAAALLAFQGSSVPEPSTLLLFATALLTVHRPLSRRLLNRF